METGWHDHYYDVLEFYYWEPQHTDRARFLGKGSKYVQIKEHLRSIEVPLNHIITLFFLLAPMGFRESFFKNLFNRTFESDLLLLRGRGLDATLA